MKYCINVFGIWISKENWRGIGGWNSKKIWNNWRKLIIKDGLIYKNTSKDEIDWWSFIFKSFWSLFFLIYFPYNCIIIIWNKIRCKIIRCIIKHIIIIQFINRVVRNLEDYYQKLDLSNTFNRVRTVSI